MKKLTLILLLLPACSVRPDGLDVFGTGGEAGAAGAAGSDAGLGGSAGQVADAGLDGDAGEAEAGEDAGPCGPLMLLSGSVCVDKQPALHADGSQGPAVSWADAVTICEARGARLCTQQEREDACPGGPEPTPNGANHAYCLGPDFSWEWSESACSTGRCRSPCCNGGPASLFHCPENACDVTAPVSSFRCCKTI